MGNTSTKHFILVVFISLLCTTVSWAQLSRVHYIPPLTSANDNNALPQAQFIYISTPSSSNVNVTIEPIGEPSANFIRQTIDVTNPAEIPLGFSYGQLFVDPATTAVPINNKGYYIHADDVIYVSVRMIGSTGGAQAGALVSKGLSALGTRFRAGMFTNENPGPYQLNFISVMATEDNTEINFSALPSGVSLINYTGSFPVVSNLDEGESFIICANTAEFDPNDGLIGTLVTSDKPIVMNSGSANGSFHNGGGRDYGIDQIVDASKIGDEYIFVKGNGLDGWENVLVVADQDNTDIFINGNTSAVTNIDAGEFYLIEGDQFSNGNLYVKTSENVFVYQGVGANTNSANQGLFFVPPLSCETKGNLENIANIDKIGSEIFPGGITIVTKVGATVTINNQDLSNFNTTDQGPVEGKPSYKTYKITGLSGNISVQCDDELYCAYFNQNSAATSGSFYSGFPSPPEINTDATFATLGSCIGDGNELKLRALNTENFESYEWLFDDGSGFTLLVSDIPEISPTQPGNYKLKGIIGCSGLELDSPVVPVSICPDDLDNDGIIDNLDLDNDNDGILNCDESYGNAAIDLQNLSSPIINVPGLGNETISGSYSQINASNSNTFIGNSDGSFVSNVQAVENSKNSYSLSFNSPLTIRFSEDTSFTGAANPNETFIVKITPLEKNLTLVDLDNRLLVDSNYDGTYETIDKSISGSEIRFRINPSPNGSRPFYFVANTVEGFTFEHELNDLVNSSSFQAIISVDCYNRDTDADGIPDSLDLDSDNDAILDALEYFGSIPILSNTDTNEDGVDDVYESLSGDVDSDTDGVSNYLDLDSDNDGIFDLEESGSGFGDTNLDGRIDSGINVGENGLIDLGETLPDSGIINFLYTDTDSDGVFNFMSLDSDADGCSDVIEAGFTDENRDGWIGNSTPPNVNTDGIVIDPNDGYKVPNPNYLIYAPITVITPLTDTNVCEEGSTSLKIETNEIDTIFWEVSSDNGVTWNTITDDSNYANSNTHELVLTDVPFSFSGNLYRTVLSKNGNSCGFISEAAQLIVEKLPEVVATIELLQCDNDTDGISVFNLFEANAKISTNHLNETFTFYESLSDAQNELNPIQEPSYYANKNVSHDKVWVQTTSSFGCSVISELKLEVTATQIPSDFLRTFYTCDDDLDLNGNDSLNNDKRDGISSFDFSSVAAEIINELPPGEPVIITFYRNETDALAEENAITDTKNYRNIGYPHSQEIYVRVDSEINNDCIGFGPHVLLNVEALPIANPVLIDRQCDDDQDGVFPFDSSTIEATLLGSQNLSEVLIEYFDENGTRLPSPLPNPFSSHSQTVTAKITNKITNAPEGPCSDETKITFIVDALPVANTVLLAPVCDDDENSNDGYFNFDTGTIHTDLLAGQPEMQVNYYAENGAVLDSPLPNPFLTDSQIVTAEIFNPINNTCAAIVELQFQVNPIPEFTIKGDTILCITEPPTMNEFSANPVNSNESYTFDWMNENGEVISNLNSVDITSPGIYVVTANTTDGTYCSTSEIIEIFPSEKANITYNDITIVDDSNNNSISIDTTNLGLGSYEFALDNPALGYQDEPYFENITPGIHTIFVRDKNKCGITSLEVSILGFPKFFTPNDDGENDVWQVQGINENFYSDAKIYIYDRFGKLLFQVDPNSDGWDGYYNSILMPSTDYWFSAELVDENGALRIRKGHFSLIRR